MVPFIFLAIVLSFLCHFTTGLPGNEQSVSEKTAVATCEQLHNRIESLITLPSDPHYTNLSDEHWSQTAWERPSCIALPNSTSDLQQLVKSLVANQVPFAIRSGGHSPNPFDANIDTGVLISMDKFNTVTYDVAQRLASFGPGARWGAIYTALDPYNVTLVGGRVMDVGVGGLTLGGGLSYLSDLYGLVCDNVVNYEVVLANGSLIVASASENSDLFWALKGGSNNFGILTKITTPTYPINQVWASVLYFSVTQMQDVVQALYLYQTTPQKDLYANLVLNLVPSNATVILTLVYLKPVGAPEAFSPFYGLPTVAQQTGFMTLHALMALFPLPDLPRWTWYANTFEPNSDLYSQISQLLSTAPEAATIAALVGGTLEATLQPINANVALAGQAKGNNALGVQAVNQTWFSIDVGWWKTDDDPIVYAAIESLHAKVDALAKNARANLQYTFMNDANVNQSVIASYGTDNLRRLHRVQRLYDPQLIFQKLVTGGQKIPAE